MKIGKRIITIALSAMLILAAVFSLTGCSKTLYTEGDFVYYIEKKATTAFGKSQIVVVGLSEEGKQKEIIEMPYTVIKGGTVISLKTNKFDQKKYWQSENLKKIYLPCGSSDTVNAKLFDGCPNLENIMLYGSSDTDLKISNKNNPDLKVFITGKNYDEEKYHGSNLYKESGKGYANIYFANVSFMHNSVDDYNDGYFLIDDCEYGGTVRRPESEPNEAFRKFDGWYWDFEKDKLPNAKMADGVVQYQETKIAAKWKVF